MTKHDADILESGARECVLDTRSIKMHKMPRQVIAGKEFCRILAPRYCAGSELQYKACHRAQQLGQPLQQAQRMRMMFEHMPQKITS